MERIACITELSEIRFIKQPTNQHPPTPNPHQHTLFTSVYFFNILQPSTLHLPLKKYFNWCLSFSHTHTHTQTLISLATHSSCMTLIAAKKYCYDARDINTQRQSLILLLYSSFSLYIYLYLQYYFLVSHNLNNMNKKIKK